VDTTRSCAVTPSCSTCAEQSPASFRAVQWSRARRAERIVSASSARSLVRPRKCLASCPARVPIARSTLSSWSGSIQPRRSQRWVDRRRSSVAAIWKLGNNALMSGEASSKIRGRKRSLEIYRITRFRSCSRGRVNTLVPRSISRRVTDRGANEKEIQQHARLRADRANGFFE